jgi:hypothetical protein
MIKLKNKISHYGIEVVFLGFWLLTLFSSQEIKWKYILFLLTVSIMIFLIRFLKFDIIIVERIGIILSFLFVFHLVSSVKLSLFGGLININYIFLFIGIILWIIEKWNSEVVILPNYLWLKSLIVSIVGLIVCSISLYIVLHVYYKLELNVIISLIKSLIIYCLVGLLGYRLTLNPHKYLRLRLYGLTCMVGLILVKII